MEFIVCNQCGCVPSKKPFFITACSHVCCETCLAPSSDFCHLCKIPTKVLKLDGNLPKNVRKIFGDPAALASDAQKRLAKIFAFQKFQKSVQLKMEAKKSTMRKEQTTKLEQKMQEISGQMAKLDKFEESTRKKLKDTEAEVEKLEKLIKRTKADAAKLDNDDDFFLKGTPTTSISSVASSLDSRLDNDEIFQFDLLGLKALPSLNGFSSSSSCSSQSDRPGSHF